MPKWIGASYPDAVLPFRWSNDLDFHTAWGLGSDFLSQLILSAIPGNMVVLTTAKDNISIKIPPHVNITLHD
nr:Os01g0964266 [Ipomoea batatas]